MKMSQLKTLMIIILVIMNVFLMFLVIPRQLTEQKQRQEERESLVRLFQNDGNGIEISVDVIPDDLDIATLDVGRDESVEARAAQVLLGEAVFADKGGGIQSYESAAGTAEFRTGGNFSIDLKSGGKYKTADSAERLFKDIGFKAHSVSFRVDSLSGLTSASAMQEINGAVLFDCSVTAVFDGTGLRSVSGTWITSAVEAAQEAGSAMGAVSALVAFLDRRTDAGMGIVCSKILALKEGYRLSSSAAKLIPVWRITADTRDYDLDALTGYILE